MPRLISVVLPVYNERDNIAACLRALYDALKATEHELLVCYDFDEDTTLPAIAAMPDRPPTVRLVRNSLGRGAPNAIRAGVAAAKGDVVVTTMADLSDPPDRIPAMAEKIRAGADVVSGSRYMPGGSQSGGPWLKRTLSRTAGLTLRWIAGVGTHDPTNNFRAYSKRFLQQVSIDSRAGFEIALELTMKAHLRGLHVSEVPSSWVDRSAGQSRFRMWKWMPNYLRWYLRSMAAPALVALAAIATFAVAWARTDWGGPQAESAARAIVIVFAAAGVGALGLARRIQGRTRWFDVVHVAIWLHPFHRKLAATDHLVADVLVSVAASLVFMALTAGPARVKAFLSALFEEKPKDGAQPPTDSATTERPAATVSTARSGDALLACLRSCAAPIFVAAVFLTMLASARTYVLRYSSTCPFWDDLEMAPQVVPGSSMTPEWLWSLHNEHRIPLPRVIYVALVKATGDFRSGMFFEVGLLAVLSLGLIYAARRLRGRTSFTDAFFPLLLLHWGNSENLLMAFQLSLMLPTALACAILILVATRLRRPAVAPVVWIGACLFALPLCGGPGITQAPPIAAWLGLAGLFHVRSPDPQSRRAGKAMIGAAAAAVALMGLYLVRFEFPHNATHSRTFGTTTSISLQLLSLAIGPAAQEYWPVSIWLVSAFAAAVILVLLAIFRRAPEERLRTSGFLACIAGVLALALSIGWGRGGDYEFAGFANRYVTLPAPLLCAAYLAFCIYGPQEAGRLVRVSLFTVMCSLVFYNVRYGSGYGELRMQNAAGVFEDVSAGLSPAQIAARHWSVMYPNEEGCGSRLEYLHAGGMQPFAGRTYEENKGVDVLPYPMFQTQPVSAASPKPIVQRRVNDKAVLLVHAEGELRFEPAAGAKIVRGKFGIFPDVNILSKSDGVRFSVERVKDDGTIEILWQQVLDPMHRSTDLGTHWFEVALPPGETGATGQIVLRTSNLPDKNDEMDWAYWTAVSIQ